MKKFSMKKMMSLAVLTSVLFISSCKTDEVKPVEPVEPVEPLTTKDLSKTINENPANGQVIGTIEAISTTEITFLIKSQTPSGAFAINATTGVVAVLDSAKFDFETTPKLTAVIEVSDDKTKLESNLTVNLNDLDETVPVTITVSDFTATMAENPANDQVIGTLSASTNQGDLTYSFSSQSPMGALGIDIATRELYVNTKHLFDFETNPTITAVITVANGGVSENINVTITLTDVAAVITADNYTLTLDENPALNFQQNLGRIVATSTEGSVSYQIFPDLVNPINIDGNGKMTVNEMAAFDYENDPSVVATIELTSGTTTKFITATFTLTDVFETVGFHNLNPVTIAENPANGAILATALASVDGAGKTPTYTLQSESVVGAFNVDFNGGEISVKDRSKFNYEVNTSLIVTIRSSANGFTSPSADLTFIVNLTDVSNTLLIERLLDQGYPVQQALDDGHTPLDIYNALGSTSGILGATYQGGTIATLNPSSGTGMLANINEMSPPNTHAVATSWAASLTDGGNSDWQLPTRAEVVLMANYLNTNNLYWTRELGGSNTAFLQNSNGSWTAKVRTESHEARAIRFY